LLNKDFDLGLAEARQLQVTMSSADLVRGHIQAALAAGMKDLDMLGALFERQMRTK
jgi:3-hydroxyisobutyrate dehydrogenase-like beta-hydroxyacid dehydrogenase